MIGINPRIMPVDAGQIGHSIGHYEWNDTLVIDTVAQNDVALIDRFGTPRSEHLHVVER